jgi:hypothetical protein
MGVDRDRAIIICKESYDYGEALDHTMQPEEHTDLMHHLQTNPKRGTHEIDLKPDQDIGVRVTFDDHGREILWIED